ncbi:MAG: response regulator [Thermoanaerobaculia bacterium]
MILIVEDDPQVARLINLVLQRHGFEGEIVADGKSALEKIRQNRPQAIFADLSIRGMSGEALCSTLKRDDATRGIPFIILSGDRDIAEKAGQCGADDHLGKPFEFEDLIRLVKKHADSR